MATCPAGHESEASDYCDTCGLVIGAESAGSGAATAAPTLTAAPPRTASAAAGGSGSGACPVCQADRNGRFCEECGYDFDLAEAMPEVTLTPGVPPVESEPAPQSEPQSQSQSQSQGLDLEAELARAEAEAAQRTAAPTPEPQPEQEPDPLQQTLALEPEAEAPESESQSVSQSEPESHSGPDSSVNVTSVLSPSSTPTPELSLVVDADRDYYKAQVERGDIIESEFPFPKYPHERRFTFAETPIRIGRASSSRGLAPEIDLTGPPLDPAVSHLHAQLLRHDEGWVVVDLGSANGTRLNDSEEPLEAETEIPVHRGDRIHLGVWTTITIQ